MIVKLLTSTRSFQDMENFAALAALTCHDNTDKMNSKGYKPSDTLKNIINAEHESILEHINLTFSVKGLSRACLQELARHRHISLSVESTRHTLRKFLREHNAIEVCGNRYNWEMAKVFDAFVRKHPDMPNDELKYYLPEFWPTNLIITLNIREFRHILKLRTAPAALEEFRFLARSMFHEVPEEFKYLLQDCVHEEGASMSEFTKGKWIIDRDGSAIFSDSEDCYVAELSPANSDEQVAANARLIAAAPEMYEELIFAIRRADKIEALLDRIDGKEAEHEPKA